MREATALTATSHARAAAAEKFSAREPRLYNVSLGVMVASNVRVARSFWARFRGLMLRRGLARGEALNLQGDSSVHMLCMRFPIDVVFYDRDLRVTGVRENLRPWIGVAFGPRGTAGAIEMAAGAAAGIAAGDRLEFMEA